MGGAKASRKRAGKPGAKARANASTKTSSESSSSAIARAIEEAYEAIEDGRVEHGVEKLRREARKFPNDIVLAEAYAMVSAEYGEHEEAIAALKRAAVLAPNEGYQKFMYLGQLLDDGEAATACTRQGLALLEMQASKGDEDAQEQHAAACCALAEQTLGTSDECDEETSAKVEELIHRARASDPTSPEPVQLLASLRNEQGKTDEALIVLKESISMWRKDGSMHRRDGAADDDDAAEEFQHEFDVSFEFRFETAKLLLELDTTTDLAVQILDELLVERDTVPDVWYMLAYAHHGALEFDLALEALKQGEELVHAKGGDKAALDNFAELRTAVMECKATVGSAGAPMED